MGGNPPAGALPDVCRFLPDAGFLSEIPRMDSVAVCGQPDLRTGVVFRVECLGLRLRDFSSAADILPGSFGRAASLDRRKIVVLQLDLAAPFRNVKRAEAMPNAAEKLMALADQARRSRVRMMRLRS